MAYTLYYGKDSGNSISVPDGQSQTVANLTFPGRNFSGYGSPVDQNFLSLAENFASSNSSGPTNPVIGQLWFDYTTANANSTVSGLKVKTDIWANLAIDANINGVGISNGDAKWTMIATKTDSGDMTVVGNITVGGWANISNNVVLGNGINVTSGGATITGVTTITGNTTVTGNLTATANITGNNATITNTTTTATLVANIINANGVVADGGNLTVANNITSDGKLNLTNTTATHTIAGSLTVTGSLSAQGGNWAISASQLSVSDTIIEMAMDDYNAPLSVNPDASGLVFHSTGLTPTIKVGNASSGSNIINVTSSTGISTGQMIGASVAGIPLGAVVGNILSATTIDIKYPNNVSALTTVAIPNGTNIYIGQDYYRFMGWDNGGSEFAFMSNANVNLSTDSIGTIGNTYGNIHFNGATAEGNITAGNITTTGNVSAANFVGSTLINGTSNVTVAASGNITLNSASTSVLTANAVSVTVTGTNTVSGDTTNITASNAALSISGGAYVSGGLKVVGNIYGTLVAPTGSTANIPTAVITTANITTANITTAEITGTANINIANITTVNTTGTATINTLNVNTAATVNSLKSNTSIETSTLTVTTNASVGGQLTTANITTGAPGTTGILTGTWTLSSGSTLEATYSADLAERHHADTQYPTGSVMTVGGINEITGANTHDRVLGVVSDDWAYLMNGGAGPQETHPAVAYVGRVPVRIVGPINKHDQVSPFSNGVATASRENSFGWALETNLDAGEKLVLCIVK